MLELRELYQQLIIDHGRNPRHFGALPEATCQHAGYNPLCGDELTVYLSHQDGVITALQFVGSGCAISMASASLMAEVLQGQSIKQVAELFAAVHALLTGQPLSPAIDLGKLQALAGVAEFPMRVKCATLAWHTLIAALKGDAAPVSTE